MRGVAEAKFALVILIHGKPVCRSTRIDLKVDVQRRSSAAAAMFSAAVRPAARELSVINYTARTRQGFQSRRSRLQRPSVNKTHK